MDKLFSCWDHQLVPFLSPTRNKMTTEREMSWKSSESCSGLWSPPPPFPQPPQLALLPISSRAWEHLRWKAGWFPLVTAWIQTRTSRTHFKWLINKCTFLPQTPDCTHKKQTTIKKVLIYFDVTLQNKRNKLKSKLFIPNMQQYIHVWPKRATTISSTENELKCI